MKPSKPPPSITMVVAQTILREYTSLKRAWLMRVSVIERDSSRRWLLEQGTPEAITDGSLHIKGTASDGTVYFLSTKRIQELAIDEAGTPPRLREIVESYADGRSDAKVKRALRPGKQ